MHHDPLLKVHIMVVYRNYSLNEFVKIIAITKVFINLVIVTKHL